jgi:ketosteroid isomerase-like protein
MSAHDHRRSSPSTAVTAAGLDHVRLSYHYLDTGDIDGYGSLLDEDAQVCRPDMPLGQGRAEVLKLHAEMAGPRVRHHIYKMVAEGDSIAVTGLTTGMPTASPGRGATAQAAAAVEFADFFTISDEGMLLGYRRFYFVPPR